MTLLSLVQSTVTHCCWFEELGSVLARPVDLVSRYQLATNPSQLLPLPFLLRQSRTRVVCEALQRH
jgi:hypothetical protein